jgi:hypothetical protein
LKAAQTQLEEAQAHAASQLAASKEEEAKRASLEKRLAEYQKATQQLEEVRATKQSRMILKFNNARFQTPV